MIEYAPGIIIVLHTNAIPEHNCLNAIAFHIHYTQFQEFSHLYYSTFTTPYFNLTMIFSHNAQCHEFSH